LQEEKTCIFNEYRLQLLLLGVLEIMFSEILNLGGSYEKESKKKLAFLMNTDYNYYCWEF